MCIRDRTATARMELDTIFANEKPCTPEDDMAMAVRCLSQLKRLWLSLIHI